MSTLPSNNNVHKRYNDIIKSPNDKREYRGLTLANKLKVLLISEPATDKSAVSLSVNIGYLNDPDDLPGLAHFCEHMLFLCTKKYPEKNGYSKYISQNGGSTNAITEMDHTVYYFDVHSEKLEGALDRFAQFFIAPLFTEDFTQLELNAINSEFEKNLANDTWRLEQVEKSSADPNHPFSKFDTGNNETLVVIPKQKGISIRERLLEFHEKFYSANLMALCVLGKESLDDLEKMVVDLFLPVKNKEVPLPVWLEHPFNEQHFQNKWCIVPVKDIRNILITFPLPDLREYYKAAPAHYVSHLLGHEGEGSLLSALKAKGWCNSLAAGKRMGGRGFNFFIVSADLTEQGIHHVDDIITLTFQYINMLKDYGPAEWIYNECTEIANMNFRFKEKSHPRDYVTGLSQVLYDHPIEEALVVGYLLQEWRPDIINRVMDYLKPENVRVYVSAKLFESIADETEKWYGTKYKKEKIAPDLIRKWIDAGLNSDFKLPPKNEFIPENFDIKPAESNITKFPVIIEDTPLLRLWFKQDNEFLVPKANLFIDFVSPLAHLDALSCCLSYMFIYVFRDALNEYAYTASIAGLKWNLINSKYGMTLDIIGYNDKQLVLLRKILDKLVNSKIDPNRYEIMKDRFVSILKNDQAEQPYIHAVYYLAVLLAEQAWTKDEMLQATTHLSLERLQKFIPQFLSKLHMECFIHGNVTTSEAIEIGKFIESKIVSSIPQIVPLLPKQLILLREVKLEDGCNFVFEVNNKYHNSSCTHVYYQVGVKSTESNMLLELLAQILSEPCFSTLRTTEQLGYIVFSDVRKVNGTQGLRIIVQSERHPAYVEQRINLFLHSMLETISSMSDEQFNAHKESLAVRRLEKPNSLTILSSIFWDEILLQEYNFDRANIEVAYLRTITLQQVTKFYKDILDSEKQHKLCVYVHSTAKEERLKSENKIEMNEVIQSPDVKDIIDIKHKKINDITAFKLSQYLYPLTKPFNDIPKKGTRSSKL